MSNTYMALYLKLHQDSSSVFAITKGSGETVLMHMLLNEPLLSASAVNTVFLIDRLIMFPAGMNVTCSISFLKHIK